LIKLIPAPLLLFSFILKLTIVTLFYSIYLLHKRIIFNLFLPLLLMLSPKAPKFHHITPILKSNWLKINERINYKVLSLPHINLSKLVNLLTSALFFHSLHIVVLGLPLLSPLVVLLSPLVLNEQLDLSSILLLFYGTISNLIYVRLFIASLLPLFKLACV